MPKCGNASLLSVVRCKQHTHPNQESARLLLWSPFDVAASRSLKMIIISKNEIVLIHIKPTPNMMNVIKSPDLRKEPSIGFVVAATIVDRSCPVVSPLDHGSWLQPIGTHFVDVVLVVAARLWLRPVAER